jgi:hypothetical protein
MPTIEHMWTRTAGTLKGIAHAIHRTGFECEVLWGLRRIWEGAPCGRVDQAVGKAT